MKKKKILLLLLKVFFVPSILVAFEIKEIEDGIYVHYGVHEETNKRNRGDICNIGFIIGKKSIMIIDPGGTQIIGRKLLEKVREISSLPISHIVITHSHPDHFFGTEAFLKENAKIIGHEKLNRSLISNFDFYKNLQSTNTGVDIVKNAILVEANVLVKVNKNKMIDLGERIIEIKAWSSGHTDNDISVYDKKTKTFWSENIFVKRTPSIRASILGWRKNLEEILKMDIKLIVPGHGKVTDKDQAIKPMINYFDRIISQIRKSHKNNKSLKETINTVQQNESLDHSKVNVENWILFKEYHYANITKAYTELEWE